MKNKNIFFVLSTVLLLPIQSILFGYDNDIAHPDILTRKAVSITTNTLTGYSEMGQYFTDDNPNNQNDIRDGTIDEDDVAWLAWHTRFHFYHPYKTPHGWSSLLGTLLRGRFWYPRVLPGI